jgi:ADP-ribosylglycohydrolase
MSVPHRHVCPASPCLSGRGSQVYQQYTQGGDAPPTTTNFRSAILLAANLGEDADTTAAVAGQLAGALYGVSGVESHRGFSRRSIPNMRPGSPVN